MGSGDNTVIPNLTVRTACFRALLSMTEKYDITVEDLKKANIGRICLDYRKMASETQSNRNVCAQLCTRWMNTVTAGKTKFSYAEIEEEPPKVEEVVRSAETARRLMDANANHRHARIPRREEFRYARRPEKVELEGEKRDANS